MPRNSMLCPRGQPPARVAASCAGIARATASINVKACSATENAETSGVFATATPWLAAAGRSTLSVPVPHTEINRRRGQSRNRSSVKREDDRMLIATSASCKRLISRSREPGSVSK
ncbi:MAG: hypothetical protein M3Y07_02595 [Acidobacteriota bacterium]|nr:hypothetical protein [Acidobacteriota bacterium]